MEVIEKSITSGGTLVLDDKFFVSCHYNGTTLLYSGGEVSSTPDTRFENCPLQFSGAAARTVALLASMGLLKPGMIPPGVTPTLSGKPH